VPRMDVQAFSKSSLCCYPNTAPELASDLTGRLVSLSMINVAVVRTPNAGDHKDSIPEYPLFHVWIRMRHYMSEDRSEASA